jgi:putative NADH-flavin reductase
MNITVIGATGRTGSLVVAEGIGRGHHVTAFTRRPGRISDHHRPATVVIGDGRDPAAVRKAVNGADAVIAIIAAAGRDGPHQAASVAAVLVDAMADLGVARLVVTSAYPIVARQPRLPMAVLRRVFTDAYADATRMERTVAASGLDWTIVRLNRLLDAPARGGTRYSTNQLDRPTALTRADAAAILLDIAADPTTARHAINAAGPARR